MSVAVPQSTAINMPESNKGREGNPVADRQSAPRRRSSPVPLVVFSASSVSVETAAPSVAASSVAEPAPVTVTLPAAVAPQSTPAGGATAASRRKHRQTRHSRTFPAQVRSMNEPKPGWTVERAVGRLAQGYSIEHVSRLSGYAVPFLRAQFR